MEQLIVSYRVKVEVTTDAPTTYLWGTATLNSKNSSVKNPGSSILFLHFRNSEDGEVVVVSTVNKDNKQELLGNFQPGEAFTLPLENIFGVNATVKSPMHTYVDCAILTSH